MNRRELIILFGGAAAAAPISAQGQSGKISRLGILANTRDERETHPWTDLFGGLRDHGYVEGQNRTVEWRYSEGHGERWPELAGELVALKVDAIVVETTPAALAAKQATSTIPIVHTSAIDPVGMGLAVSLARPGGNVTGIGLLMPELGAKALALLQEAVPTLDRVAVLWNAAHSANANVME